MARRQSNTLAIIIWVLGILGCLGYLHPFGYIPLVIPIIFWLFGNKFTKDHCRQYFNVLITGLIIYVLGIGIDYILELFKINTYQFMYISLIYLLIMCIFGLITALNNRKYNPVLSVNVF